MLGVKLRSEKIDQFDVLGERGQAIHLVASQILTVLKNKRPDLLVNFAVPQPSENGRRIDWYAPTPGSVISWNAATATEQAGALVRLDAVRAGVAQLRDSVLAKGSGNDAALLGQLLKWILHHPDSSFVFLVDGQPVITFWGFVHNGADRTLDPLHALRPAVPVARQCVRRQLKRRRRLPPSLTRRSNAGHGGSVGGFGWHCCCCCWPCCSACALAPESGAGPIRRVPLRVTRPCQMSSCPRRRCRMPALRVWASPVAQR